jgi:hypothetical protein
MASGSQVRAKKKDGGGFSETTPVPLFRTSRSGTAKLFPHLHVIVVFIAIAKSAGSLCADRDES